MFDPSITLDAYDSTMTRIAITALNNGTVFLPQDPRRVFWRLQLINAVGAVTVTLDGSQPAAPTGWCQLNAVGQGFDCSFANHGPFVTFPVTIMSTGFTQSIALYSLRYTARR